MTNQTAQLLRPVFFERQQLSAVDLNEIVHYQRQRLRRHNRFLHGWGVVCGLQVNPVDGDPWKVQIQPGYALAPTGDEIFLPLEDGFDVQAGVDACLPDLAQPCKDPQNLEAVAGVPAEPVCVSFEQDSFGANLANPYTENGFTFTSPGQMFNRIEGMANRAGLALLAGLRIDLPASQSIQLELANQAQATLQIQGFNDQGTLLWTQAVANSQEQAVTLQIESQGMTHLIFICDEPRVGLIFNICITPVIAETLAVYLAVRPDSAPKCARPAIPANCQPPGSDMFPSRQMETYQFAVLCALPASHQEEPLNCETLGEIFCGKAHVPCPPEPEDDYVVLAQLCVTADGVVEIDDLTARRQLFSEQLQDDYLHCLCIQNVPVGAITAIQPAEVQGTFSTPVVRQAVILGSGLQGANQVTFSGGNIQANIVDNSQSGQSSIAITLVAGHATGQVAFEVLFPDNRPPLHSADFNVFLNVSLPELSIKSIDPNQIRGNILVPTTHSLTINGAGLLGAINVAFTPPGIQFLGIQATAPDHINLAVLLQAGASPGTRTFIVNFPDGRPTLNSASFGVALQVLSPNPLPGGLNVGGEVVSTTGLDLEAASTQPVESVPGIGAVLGDRLRKFGIQNPAAFAGLPDEVAAKILDTSPQNAAKLKAEAIKLMKG